MVPLRREQNTIHFPAGVTSKTVTNINPSTR